MSQKTRILKVIFVAGFFVQINAAASCSSSAAPSPAAGRSSPTARPAAFALGDLEAGDILESPEDCATNKDRPIWVGGSIVGYPDGRAVNADIGVDQYRIDVDDEGKYIKGPKVDILGYTCDRENPNLKEEEKLHNCYAGYSWGFRVNQDISPEGSTDTKYVRKFGRCIADNIDVPDNEQSVSIEVYPKDQKNGTDKIRFGGTMMHAVPVSELISEAGIKYRGVKVDLRLPETFEATGGNTGSVNGYITCNGKACPPIAEVSIRAWSTHPWNECGIRGYSGGEDDLGPSGSGNRLYYRVKGLAGGQCWAPQQRYKLVVSFKCGDKTLPDQTRYINIRPDAQPREDFDFGYYDIPEYDGIFKAVDSPTTYLVSAGQACKLDAEGKLKAALAPGQDVEIYAPISNAGISAVCKWPTMLYQRGDYPGIAYVFPSPWDGGMTQLWCGIPNHQMYLKAIGKFGRIAVKLSDGEWERVHSDNKYWSQNCGDSMFN